MTCTSKHSSDRRLTHSRSTRGQLRKGPCCKAWGHIRVATLAETQTCSGVNTVHRRDRQSLYYNWGVISKNVFRIWRSLQYCICKSKMPPTPHPPKKNKREGKWRREGNEKWAHLSGDPLWTHSYILVTLCFHILSCKCFLVLLLLFFILKMLALSALHILILASH